MPNDEINNNGRSEDNLTMSEMMAAAFSELEEGKQVKAKVLRIGKEHVIVDVGYKSDGLIPINEFLLPDGSISVKPGDVVSAVVDRFSDGSGTVILSKLQADRLNYIDFLEKAYRNREVVEGRIVQEIKGGFLVDIGAEAFLPHSQYLPEENTGGAGAKLPFKIIKFGRNRGEIVVSHKLAAQDKSRRLRQDTWASLTEGEVRKGTVKSITSYGAFIDIGEVTGLLHISDMSWGKVNHPAELLALESEVEVKVVRIDREKNRVSFGLKQLQDDPWLTIEQKFPIGSEIHGKIVNIVDYGAFIRLEEGIEGLLHISDLSWTRKVKNPSELVAIGDSVRVKVLNIDKNNRKILFGLKQLEMDPFSGAEEKFTPGLKVTGSVTGSSATSVFLELEGGVEGILNKKEISWIKRINEVKALYRKGEKLEAVVLNLDKANRKVHLGMKQLLPDPWLSEIPSKYAEGTVVSCKVVRTVSFGVFCELEDGLDAFIHISELAAEPVDSAEGAVKAGEEKRAKVIKLDKEGRKISLSIKQALFEVDKHELKKYQNESGARSTFGDILKKPQ